MNSSEYNRGWYDAELDADTGVRYTEVELLTDGWSVWYVLGYTDASSVGVS